MKRNILLSALAILAIYLVAFCFNAYVLLALVVFIPVFLFRKYLHKDEVASSSMLTLDEANAEYGEPDDCVVVDATRANEVAGCILVYKAKRLLLVAGEPLGMDDVVDVATVNTATPYTLGQYQLVITTRKPGREYVRMDAGLDSGWAMEVAKQVIDALKCHNVTKE